MASRNTTISKAKKEFPYYKFFHLNKVSDQLDIQVDKLYNNFANKYDSLGDDKKRVADFMIPHVSKFFQKLGYGIIIKKGDKAA